MSLNCAWYKANRERLAGRPPSVLFEEIRSFTEAISARLMVVAAARRISDLMLTTFAAWISRCDEAFDKNVSRLPEVVGRLAFLLYAEYDSANGSEGLLYLHDALSRIHLADAGPAFVGLLRAEPQRLGSLLTNAQRTFEFAARNGIEDGEMRDMLAVLANGTNLHTGVVAARESSRVQAACAVIYHAGQNAPTIVGSRSVVLITLVGLWATMRAVDSGWLRRMLLPTPFLTVVSITHYADDRVVGAMIDAGLVELLAVELSGRAFFEMRGLSA